VVLTTLTLSLAAPLPAEATPGAADGLGPARIGESAPALEVDTLEGDLLTMARLAGKTLVVDFFATWCGPCHTALADLNDAAQAVGDDLAFVLIDLNEPADTVRRWSGNAKLPPGAVVALDPNGAAARRWGVRKLPTTFIIDPAGTVRKINRGWGPGYRNRLIRWLRDAKYWTSGSPTSN
jgi:thiol-disulfide isomerase/thioredoxin